MITAVSLTTSPVRSVNSLGSDSAYTSPFINAEIGVGVGEGVNVMVGIAVLVGVGVLLGIGVLVGVN